MRSLHPLHNTRKEIILHPTTSSTASPQAKPVIDRKQHNTILFVLASLSAIGPISVDMYLPGFPAIAADLKTDTRWDDSFESFETSLDGQSAGAGSNGGRATGLKNFAEQRRNFLLNHPEVKKAMKGS